MAKKIGGEGYDPCYKYDFIWSTLFYNINIISKSADLDECGDKTSWAHAGYSDVTGKIFKKPKVNRGGQTVICNDVSCNQPRAFVHCHKLMEHPDGIAAKEQAEVIHIAKKIEKMVVSNENFVLPLTTFSLVNFHWTF